MHGPINVKSPNNASKWQMGFNLAFKGLMYAYKVKMPKKEFSGSSIKYFSKKP
jgi:hypothetical protein